MDINASHIDKSFDKNKYFSELIFSSNQVFGEGLSGIWPYLLGLIVFIFILSVLNTLALKKYRTI